jgi:hypothetical protein
LANFENAKQWSAAHAAARLLVHAVVRLHQRRILRAQRIRLRARMRLSPCCAARSGQAPRATAR